MLDSAIDELYEPPETLGLERLSGKVLFSPEDDLPQMATVSNKKLAPNMRESMM